MSILQVNLGTYANDGTGDDLRSAFEKSNANFNELDLTRVITADNLGSGAPVFKEKIGNNLQLRTIKQGLNMFVTYTGNEITIAAPDSINAVEEDPAPRLSANLNLNNKDIIGTGNIYITGEVVADEFIGPLTGNVTGNVTGNLTGNSLGTHTGPVIGNVTGNLTGNVTGDVTGDVTGNLYGNVVGNVTGDLTGDVYATTVTTNDLIVTNNATIDSDLLVYGTATATGFVGPLTGNVTGNLTGNSAGTHTGPVIGNVIGDLTGNVTGDLTGNVTGNVVGNLTGNVTGRVSDISNHNLSELNDVLSTVPTSGQALVWNGTAWGPGTITSGVSRIIAGSNVSITPSSGLGAVTISATSGGGEINTFDFGNFKNIFTNPNTYFLYQVGADFGSFAAPGQFTVDLGLF
jgi:hypothetical protein